MLPPRPVPGRWPAARCPSAGPLSIRNALCRTVLSRAPTQPPALPELQQLTAAETQRSALSAPIACGSAYPRSSKAVEIEGPLIRLAIGRLPRLPTYPRSEASRLRTVILQREVNLHSLHPADLPRLGPRLRMSGRRGEDDDGRPVTELSQPALETRKALPQAIGGRQCRACVFAVCGWVDDRKAGSARSGRSYTSAFLMLSGPADGNIWRWPSPPGTGRGAAWKVALRPFSPVRLFADRPQRGATRATHHLDGVDIRKGRSTAPELPHLRTWLTRPRHTLFETLAWFRDRALVWSEPRRSYRSPG